MAYTQVVTSLFEQWRSSNAPILKHIGVGSHPKQLIEQLAEEMLRVFAGAQLIDKYDVYQHLMSYWSDGMQDDVYIIAQDGWQANSDLMPPQMIIQRYFVAELQHIELLEAARDEITRKLEDLEEEHGGEGGLLEEAKNEKVKITKASVKARMRDIFGEPDTEDEQAKLSECLDLLEQETEASKKVKVAQKVLEAKVNAQYNKLSENEVKTLVVNDKWLATLSTDVQTELNRVSQALTGRVKELGERYVTPLPRLAEDVEVLGEKVNEHLQRMGFAWEKKYGDNFLSVK